MKVTSTTKISKDPGDDRDIVKQRIEAVRGLLIAAAVFLGSVTTLIVEVFIRN